MSTACASPAEPRAISSRTEPALSATNSASWMKPSSSIELRPSTRPPSAATRRSASPRHRSRRSWLRVGHTSNSSRCSAASSSARRSSSSARASAENQLEHRLRRGRWACAPLWRPRRHLSRDPVSPVASISYRPGKIGPGYRARLDSIGENHPSVTYIARCTESPDIDGGSGASNTCAVSFRVCATCTTSTNRRSSGDDAPPSASTSTGMQSSRLSCPGTPSAVRSPLICQPMTRLPLVVTATW